ncbi:DUF4376 domain-containing protein [Segatella hominis]|uniref:DUF4376 domain-containing protein n=1 Tax=Segatella hominis TaxID=2518605 RepID=UPI00296EE6B9|nr:DUF4376 domain-containing protein [Segatella hominis]WOZ81534.1 DUF4376 domain-containing protein [Segatella hominis]
MKINFIKTIIPEAAFKKQYELGSLMIYHIGEALNKELGAYECYECSMAVSSFDEEEVKNAFDEYIQGIEKIKLQQAKQDKLQEIDTYDLSSAVNGFMLNGLLVWLDKATRVGLMNSTTIAKAAGQETTTLWLGGLKLVVDCDKAIQLLSALEMYALECFNVTASHKAAVNELTTVEEVETYDYKAGYPKMLEMSV